MNVWFKEKGSREFNFIILKSMGSSVYGIDIEVSSDITELRERPFPFKDGWEKQQRTFFPNKLNERTMKILIEKIFTNEDIKDFNFKQDLFRAMEWNRG